MPLEGIHLKRRLVVDLTVPRDPKAVFEGGYIKKADLEVVIRAIRRAHRKLIHDYREQRIIAKYEASKKKKEEVSKDDADKQSKEQPSERVGQGQTNTADHGSDAEDSRPAGRSGGTAEGRQGGGDSSRSGGS
jgi:hypothetical protein